MKSLAFLTLVLTITGCSSQPVLPEASSITTSRRPPDKSCQLLSKVTGISNSTKGTPEQALEDMKQDAANRGANYLMVMQYSGTGTSVTGMAYKCP